MNPLRPKFVYFPDDFTFNLYCPIQHPLVRVHPTTGEKALYVNQGFTKRIVGFKVEESEYLLKFLFDHLAKGSDFQIRATYKPGTVVVWVRGPIFIGVILG